MIRSLGRVGGGLILLAVLWSAGLVRADQLQPFVSDGCSLFPDGLPGQPELWRSCCVDHDRAYWKGGTRRQRRAADKELGECVAALGAPKVAAAMTVGVRLGGTPYLPVPFRWGFGWSYPRGYGPLSEAEQKQVAKRLAEEGLSGK
ncbi:MAG: hypothetical protein R6W72_10295 [Desulfurivibrionaceae bacterium]